MRTKGEPVIVVVHNADGTTAQIGTWGLPGDLIDNYSAQKDIGWFAMKALYDGAKRVEVVIGEPSPHDIRSEE